MTGARTGGKGQETLIETYERVADLGPDDRRAALNDLREREPALADRVDRLLASEREAESWIEGLERSLARGLAAELDSAWAPGRVVGPYRLERLLATGGMDAVFIARKADGELKRSVALKLVPAGLVDSEALERFRGERDLLASLVHPNIAALLDAGISEEGQPWFAMELIDGARIDAWSRKPSVRRSDCVKQFHALVGAVAFAHRKLVVHGDLKPGNVMIDSSGRLRLLDFGIARLMGEIPRDETPRYFTERYAAPEVRGGARADTAADIYSLGVMFSEIVESRVWASGAAGRDLDAIILRARAEHPEDRYETARQLADDLGRWLRGEPVMARAGGVGYRLSRRVRRHPLATAAIVLAGLGLVALSAVSRIQADRFERERDKARELAGFLEQVFVSADPATAPGETLTARDLLDRGRERLEIDTTDPSVRVDFLSVLGRTYQRLGDYPTAEALLDEALALGASSIEQGIDLRIERAETHRLAGEFDAASSMFRELLDGAQDLSDASKARALAGLGRTLAQAGKPAEAVPLLEESLERTRGLDGFDPGVLANRLNDTGSALFRLGRVEQAIKRLDEALALRRELDRGGALVEGSPRTATLVNNLGLMHYLRGNRDAAEPLLREALAMRRAVLADDHPDLAQTLTNLGLMLKDYGSAEAAIPFLDEALRVRRSGLDPGHYRIAQAILNLATAYRKAGRLEEAEPLLADALARLTEALGPGNPQVAVAHNEMGALLFELDRAEAAEASHRRALAIQRAALPSGHPHLAWSLLGLGRSLSAQGKHDAARPVLTEAVEIRRRTLPEGDPLRVEAERALARVAASRRADDRGRRPNPDA